MTAEKQHTAKIYLNHIIPFIPSNIHEISMWALTKHLCWVFGFFALTNRLLDIFLSKIYIVKVTFFNSIQKKEEEEERIFLTVEWDSNKLHFPLLMYPNRCIEYMFFWDLKRKKFVIYWKNINEKVSNISYN